MTRGLVFVSLAIIVGLGVACSVSKNPGVRLVGMLVFGLLSLAATALTVLLVHVGIRNHWSSDGPGMLLVMIGIGLFGFAAIAGWKFVWKMMSGREPRA